MLSDTEGGGNNHTQPAGWWAQPRGASFGAAASRPTATVRSKKLRRRASTHSLLLPPQSSHSHSPQPGSPAAPPLPEQGAAAAATDRVISLSSLAQLQWQNSRRLTPAGWLKRWVLQLGGKGGACSCCRAIAPTQQHARLAHDEARRCSPLTSTALPCSTPTQREDGTNVNQYHWQEVRRARHGS
jgi:hypothetical protein